MLSVIAQVLWTKRMSPMHPQLPSYPDKSQIISNSERTHIK